jgi:hypothetical protein
MYFFFLMSFAKDFFKKLRRFLKFSCWFLVYFVARLLDINTLPLSPSQKTDQHVEKLN